MAQEERGNQMTQGLVKIPTMRPGISLFQPPTHEEHHPALIRCQCHHGPTSPLHQACTTMHCLKLCPPKEVAQCQVLSIRLVQSCIVLNCAHPKKFIAIFHYISLNAFMLFNDSNVSCISHKKLGWTPCMGVITIVASHMLTQHALLHAS